MYDLASHLEVQITEVGLCRNFGLCARHVIPITEPEFTCRRLDHPPASYCSYALPSHEFV